MKLIYGVKDRPKTGQLFVFALQQLLAILAATITVPTVVNASTGANLSISAALFGAGAGTLVYLAFTKFKSPVFLGSSFAFIGPMIVAVAGAASMTLGYLGLFLGALFGGLVYVVISLIVKFAGTAWINKIMPAVVIGPTVAIIGLSLAGSAVNNILNGVDAEGAMTVTSGLGLVCALVTLGVTIACSVFGKKMLKMIPFIIGILAGYILAAIFTSFSYIDGAESMRLIDFSIFENLKEASAWYPDFTFVNMFKGNYGDGNIGAYIGTIAVAYIPVAFVVFAEHIADHKNISSIIEHDLLQDPGLDKTLLGDGVGSMVGAFFGGCPNTTYGESVGCVAISRNASVWTIVVTAGLAIVVSFIAPFVLFLSSIPSCVMGGVCVALYGFIAVSGLKMIQKVDLEDNRNLFVVSVILIVGIGGMSLTFGKVTITPIATALILGIVTNVLLHAFGKKSEGNTEEAAGDTVAVSEGTASGSDAAKEAASADETNDNAEPLSDEILKEEK